MFGQLQILLHENFEEGLKWGQFAISAIENSSGTNTARVRLGLYGNQFFWYIPLEETHCKLHEAYMIGMKCGDIDSAMFALAIEWAGKLYEGVKLSLLSIQYDDNLKYFVSVGSNCQLYQYFSLCFLTVIGLFTYCWLFLDNSDQIQQATSSEDICVEESLPQCVNGSN